MIRKLVLYDDGVPATSITSTIDALGRLCGRAGVDWSGENNNNIMTKLLLLRACYDDETVRGRNSKNIARRWSNDPPPPFEYVHLPTLSG